MKKKISLVGLILLLIFSFTGCGSKAQDTAEYNPTLMQNHADMIIQSFNPLSEAELNSFADMSDIELDILLMQSGLPVKSKDFLLMTQAWNAAIKEYGSLVETGKYKIETENKSATVTANVQFEKRIAEVVFKFDEKMNLESLTFNGNYSTREILKKAALNTVLGMGTVFIVLIFISFIISMFKYIPVIEKLFQKKNQNEEDHVQQSVSESMPKSEVPVGVELSQEIELVAVITAAIAAAEGTSTDGFVVRSINRRKTNKWS